MKARSLLALALAALLVPAATLAAPPSQGLSVGGFLGYETDDLSGLSLRVDGELPFSALTPQLTLSFVGSVGFSYLTWDRYGYDLSAKVFKVIPAARFSFAINPQFSVFGDAGLGFYYASVDLDAPPSPFTDAFEDELGGLGLMMRFGAGAWYHVNESVRVGAMLEFDPYFNDFDQTTFIFQGGAMFRL